jgi:hypothetical protein
MPQPTGGDLYVSRPLTNISVAYMQAQEDFIADRVFPPVPVEHQYGMYYKYVKGEWFKTMAQKRGPRSESAGTGWNVTTDTYRAEVQAVHTDIDDQDRANQDSPVIDLDRDGTLFVTRDILLRREKDWADTYFKTSLWANTDQTGVPAGPAANQFIYWSATAGTPVVDIEEQRINMKKKTGFTPNRLVLGAEVESALKSSDDILDRIKYTQRGQITRAILSALFEVDVLVPTVIENTAAEGAAEAMAFVYGKSALLAYAAPNPSRLTPSAGYVFEWTGLVGTARGSRIKKFRMEPIASDRIEVESAYDFKVVSTDLGVFFDGAVA